MLMLRAFVGGAVLVAVAGLLSVAVSADTDTSSPPSSAVAYAAGGDIYRIGPDGADVARLTNDPANDSSPAFSPGGAHLLFVSDRGGSPRLFQMNSDGTDQAAMPTSMNIVSAPTYSPDGSKIAYFGRPDFTTPLFGIFVANTDGSDVTKVYESLRIVGSSPLSFSADGASLLFTVNLPGTGLNLFRINVDGTAETNLTGGAGGASGRYSRDGSHIVFATNRLSNSSDPNNFDIAIMNADGTGQEVLRRTTSQDVEPAFSPDGRSIVYASYPSTSTPEHADLFVINTDGSGMRNLTNSTGMTERQPAWGRTATAPTPTATEPAITPAPTITPRPHSGGRCHQRLISLPQGRVLDLDTCRRPIVRIIPAPSTGALGHP